MSEKNMLIVEKQANSPAAEAFRMLQTNMQFAKEDGQLKTVMFTSTAPGEGKSTIAANTAVTLAQMGKRVIIMDCDLHKPVQHKFFGVFNKGLTNALLNNAHIESLIQNTGFENLRILTSGPIPPNPAELLNSRDMEKIIDNLKSQADYVLIDVPPVVAVSDACLLAAKVDGINFIIKAGATRPEMVQKARELLIKAKGHLLGVTLNDVETEDHAYYFDYYESETQAVK